MSKFRAPVRSKGNGYVIDIGDDEAEVLLRLISELRSLLTDTDLDPTGQALLARLFPVVYPDDEEFEAEYQRLMRSELVESKLSALTIVEDALNGNGRVDEGQLIAFMQSVNSVRLVLGTMLDIGDDTGEDDEVDVEQQDSPEYHLYSYLSWLLEWSVRALS